MSYFESKIAEAYLPPPAIETFTEVETGADALDRRQQLAAAIRAVRKAKCPVVPPSSALSASSHTS
jgi:hypothetical protein